MSTSYQANLARIESTYGVVSTDSFDGDIAALHQLERDDMYLDEFLAAAGRFTRIRLITERGYPYMDLSYAYGVLPNGTEVRLHDGSVDVNHGLGRSTYRGEIAKAIKAAGGSYSQQQQAWDTGVYAILWG